MQAHKVEELAEGGNASDRGDASQVRAPDLIAPLPISAALLFSASLKLSVAETDIQTNSAFR